MRGKPLCSRPPTAGNRITPAGAGKTGRIAHVLLPAPDHPRRCGENLQSFTFCFKSAGSPPQVRGKLGFWLSLRAVLRITPAGAGKTGSTPAVTSARQDHPRRCGENRVPFPEIDIQIGSPPQVRGKLSFSRSLLGVTRITPAGAGKTKACSLSTNTAWDHPRRCGENYPAVGGCRYAAGITPAGAGKT